MFGRMQRMAMRDLGMVRGLFVIAGLVMLRSFAMVFGGVLVVMRGLVVMFVNLVTVHRSLPGCRIILASEHCRDR